MGLFQQIATAGSREGLRFLVIGGLAVVHYGYSRDTADLDLLIRRDDRERWLRVFLELGYTVDQDRDVFVQLSPPQAGAWPVDLMLVRDPTFNDMLAAAVPVNMFGAEVLVPALEHLLALKVHALKHGHLGRHLKDYLDVENLIRINHLDLNSDPMRRLFEKHGTLELYEKLSRTSARE
jgi:predicted nucleotidyltransferase